MSFSPHISYSSPNEEIECKYISPIDKSEYGCGWKGTIKDTKVDHYNFDNGFLSKRQGIIFLCPVCNRIIKDEIHLIS